MSRPCNDGAPHPFDLPARGQIEALNRLAARATWRMPGRGAPAVPPAK